MRLALLLLVACGAAERPCSSPAPEIKRVVERVPCLNMPPPLRPDRDPDPGLDRARQMDYLNALDLWARLYAWPTCRVVP